MASCRGEDSETGLGVILELLPNPLLRTRNLSDEKSEVGAEMEKHLKVSPEGL